jgi:hypothetical protein
VLPALAKVDEVYQAPVALYYLCDHSYKDIAVVLDVPIGTVKSRIARGIAQLRRLFSPMAAAKFISLWLTIYWIVAGAVQAELFSLAASGTIAKNSSGDTTLPVGTPWTFEIIYDTAAPDLDFELTGSPVATFGRFTNTGAIPAVTFVHYQAANYEVTIDDPKDFDAFSEIDITLGRESEIDINLNALASFRLWREGRCHFTLTSSTVHILISSTSRPRLLRSMHSRQRLVWAWKASRPPTFRCCLLGWGYRGRIN